MLFQGKVSHSRFSGKTRTLEDARNGWVCGLYSQCRRYSTFTLIELLVVITILAILASILLPVLKSARHKALVLKCTSHLRQQGVAHNVYRADYNGFFPTFGGSVPDSWGCRVSTGPGRGGALFNLQSPGAGGARKVYLIEYLDSGTKSLSQQELMRCPVRDWPSVCNSWPGPAPYPPGAHRYPIRGPHNRAGYAFYTGRLKHNECDWWRTKLGWNTRKRRHDGAELLVTDILMYNYRWNGSRCGMNLDPSVPYFNPHVSPPRPRVTRRGSANQLTADGAVKSVLFRKTSTTTKLGGGGRGKFMALAVEGGKKNTNSSLTQGPYYRAPRD